MNYYEVSVRLSDIKSKFELANIPGSKLTINPVSNSSILNEFPEFYKIFLSEIGTVYLSYYDQFIFEVSLPKRTNVVWFLDEDFNHNGASLIFHSDDQEIIYIILDSEFQLSEQSSLYPINVKEFSDMLCSLLDGMI